MMASSTAPVRANGGVRRCPGEVWKGHAQGERKRGMTATRRRGVLARPGRCPCALWRAVTGMGASGLAVFWPMSWSFRVRDGTVMFRRVKPKGEQLDPRWARQRRRGPWPAAPPCCVGAPQPLSPPFLRVLLRPENLSHGGYLAKSYSRLAGRRTPREKSSPAGRNPPGKFLPEGEIDAIAIVIELDIISIIIIIIISTIYTAITTAAPRHRCNDLDCKKEKILTKFAGESYEFNFSKFTKTPYKVDLPSDDFKMEQCASIVLVPNNPLQQHLENSESEVFRKERDELEEIFLRQPILKHDLPVEDLGTTPPPKEDPVFDLKPLPDNLKYAHIDDKKIYPVIISSKLSEIEEERLLEILKKHRGAIGYTLDDLKGISPSICQHAINMEDDAKPVVEHQRRLIPKMKEVVRNEVLKLLEAGIIYPIADSRWVSPVHCVPKKGGMTVVPNDNDELIPQRVVVGRFIKDFSKISKPLTNLLQKDVPFVFDDDCKEAFETLKKALTTAPVVEPPDWNLPFEIMCDASDFALSLDSE
ncbi:hypothetical protein QYE76_023212 [Lolium multiflorum]|uniref:Reverse transcriptase/retrotransposon-derived protein RNase H-like domain-containing protein n=1 Tax=Lolium multiflorum TaxID=4521 RepID=A0AAD8RB92_LOLMU|nr:hypothetical protein QYE76_023212 [Lolium multiflorum]